MRNTVSISLPPEMMKDLDQMAKREGLTRSEMVRESVRSALFDRKFGWPKEKAQDAAFLYRGHFTLIEPKPLDHPVCRDPGDDQVIAVALRAGAHAVATGDKDLLSLVAHQGIRFVSPREFWDFSAEGE